MRRGSIWVVGALCIAIGASSPAYAQGGSGTSSLGGVVVDSGGGVIPGATVVHRQFTGTYLHASSGQSRLVQINVTPAGLRIGGMVDGRIVFDVGQLIDISRLSLGSRP